MFWRVEKEKEEEEGKTEESAEMIDCLLLIKA